MTIPTDQPGWRPDPEKPGMVRWWNGLGWSDARRTADEAIQRVQALKNDAARGSTITTQQVARDNGDRPGSAFRAASATAAGSALALSNPFAGAAIGLGVVGLLFGAAGVVSVIALIVSILGLLRARRLAANGRSKTGLAQSLGGLLLSLVSLLRWLPALTALIPSDLLNS